MKIKSLVAASLLTLSAAQAAVIINVAEVGSDVIFTGSGSIDITGATVNSSSSINLGAVHPTNVQYHNLTGARSQYTNTLTGPSNFGSGGGNSSGTPTGDSFSLLGTSGYLYLTPGYSSGDALNFETTFTGQTFAGLGMTPGSYQWLFGGITGNTITMNISAAPTVVPAPLPLGLLALGGLIGLGLSKRRVN